MMSNIRQGQTAQDEGFSRAQGKPKVKSSQQTAETTIQGRKVEIFGKALPTWQLGGKATGEQPQKLLIRPLSPILYLICFVFAIAHTGTHGNFLPVAEIF